VSTEPAPKCPQCGVDLQLGASGKLHAWSCPAAHGLGFTLSAAYERLEDDEVHAIWHASEQAAAGKHTCPFCSAPMVSVTVAVGGAGSPQETLDVCREDEFIWFDPGELDEFPQHTLATAPSPEEQARIEQLRGTFDHDLDAAADAGVMDRFANHVVAHHPGIVHLLDRMVYGHELDDLDEQRDATAA
jgi:Zn-finger nucleic acid-binding protein